jgi:hypothetical protein
LKQAVSPFHPLTIGASWLRHDRVNPGVWVRKNA